MDHFDQRLMSLAVSLARLGNAQDGGYVQVQPVATTRNQNESRSNSQSRSPLEQLFEWEDTLANYMKSGKSEEAYEVVKKQYKRGAEVHFSSVLIKYYVTLMQTNRPEKAVKVRDQLMTLLLDNVDVSMEDIERYGHTRMPHGGPFEAFLFYQIAVRFSENETNSADVINSLHRCCAKTAVLVDNLLTDRKTSKQLVRCYILPFMRKINSRIGRFLYQDKKQVSFVQGVCLHYISQCECELGDMDSRESTINEAIGLFRENLGKDAEKRQVFGALLNNLGHTYLVQNKKAEAARLFTQAIAAKSAAEDYDSLGEKLEDIKKSKLGLATARN